MGTHLTGAPSVIKCRKAHFYSSKWLLFPIVIWDSFRWALSRLLYLFFIQLAQLQAEHKLALQSALNIPSKRLREGLLTAQQEFLKHGQSSKVYDLTKLALNDEKDLGDKVIGTGENINKSIHWDIITIYGTESVSPKDTVKKGILGVIPSLLFLSHWEINHWSFLLYCHRC